MSEKTIDISIPDLEYLTSRVSNLEQQIENLEKFIDKSNNELALYKGLVTSLDYAIEHLQEQLRSKSNNQATSDRTVTSHLLTYIRKHYKNNSDDCPICMEKISTTQLQLLQCGHTYHVQCWKDMINNTDNLRCAVCRS
ncbi:hypothetical protein CL622_01945 [archaeon]|nr:hypothetical protein [archaeon]